MLSVDDLKARIGIDRAKGTYPGYHYMRLTLGEFIEHQYKVKDLVIRATDGTVHPRLSSIRYGKQGICDRYRPPSSCHPEEDMPSGL